MFGLDELINHYCNLIPGGTDIFPILALIIFMVVNTILSTAIAVKKKEFTWDKIADFAKPMVYYMLLLFVLEIAIVSSSSFALIQLAFTGIQVSAWSIITVKYIVQVYQKLKDLGMPQDVNLDRAIEEKLGVDISSEEVK